MTCLRSHGVWGRGPSPRLSASEAMPARSLLSLLSRPWAGAGTRLCALLDDLGGRRAQSLALPPVLWVRGDATRNCTLVLPVATKQACVRK